jgi:hypothetical protein
MDLGHRIVAMVGGAPKRVVCMTCDSEHNYRAPKVTATPRGPRKAAPAPKTASATGEKKAPKTTNARAEWERQVRSGRPMRRYTINETFDVGDLVTHKKFGDGYVVSILGDGKLTIAFLDGERTLIHAVAS